MSKVFVGIRIEKGGGGGGTNSPSFVKALVYIGFTLALLWFTRQRLKSFRRPCKLT